MEPNGSSKFEKHPLHFKHPERKREMYHPLHPKHPRGYKSKICHKGYKSPFCQSGNKSLICQPSLESITKIRNLAGENLCLPIIEKVKIVNNIKRLKKKSFSWYKKSIAEVFVTNRRIVIKSININKKVKSVKYKNFYGGFVVAEGSINVSAKKSKGALFGIIIDTEFSVTQHVNGFSLLFDALSLFETGSIDHKSGSNSTMVYRIDNRKSLIEKVIPFWETYIFPYISTPEKEKYILFKKILFFLEEKKHKDIHFFVNTILPIWDKLKKQKGQKNDSFPNLEAATLFAIEKEKEKRKGSSETIRDLI